MKSLSLFVSSVLVSVLAGCSTLPMTAQVEDGKFRFENFKMIKGSQNESVHLMCYLHKPTGWSQPKQYEAGKHLLWVKANVENDSIENSTKSAYASLNVELEANKSYMLNRERDGDKISLWVQEVDTGVRVSDIVVTDLKKPLISDYSLRRNQCKAGTV